MSNYLAFATVTATLVDLLDAAAKKAVAGALATTERPDLLDKNAVGVNIFLFQVTPNAAWRNADLPTRRPDGTAVQRPQAAFDLHYLLSFHGTETQYEPQRILGSVVSVLHSQPVLSREMVRDASKTPLAASNLADQVELVRLSPMGLNLEELSKLWSVFFQVPYRLSLAYQASVVLLDAEVTVQPALPVQARNLYVMPFRQPEVDEVIADAGPGLPILPGGTIVLRGRNLRGDETRVRIGGVDIKPDAEKVSDGEIRVALPAGLPAGVLGCQAVHLLWMGTPPETPYRHGIQRGPFRAAAQDQQRDRLRAHKRRPRRDRGDRSGREKRAEGRAPPQPPRRSQPPHRPAGLLGRGGGARRRRRSRRIQAPRPACRPGASSPACRWTAPRAGWRGWTAFTPLPG